MEMVYISTHESAFEPFIVCTHSITCAKSQSSMFHFSEEMYVHDLFDFESKRRKDWDDEYKSVFIRCKHLVDNFHTNFLVNVTLKHPYLTDELVSILVTDKNHTSVLEPFIVSSESNGKSIRRKMIHKERMFVATCMKKASLLKLSQDKKDKKVNVFVIHPDTQFLLVDNISEELSLIILLYTLVNENNYEWEYTTTLFEKRIMNGITKEKVFNVFEYELKNMMKKKKRITSSDMTTYLRHRM